MSWQPQNAALNEITETFRASFKGDNKLQKEVLKKMTAFKEEPEYSYYLTYILANCNYEDQLLTAVAIALNRYIESRSNDMSSANMEYVKNNLLAIFNSGKQIPFKNSLLLTAVTIIKNKSFSRFPEFLNFLKAELNSDSPDHLLTGLKTLIYLLEDAPFEMNYEVFGEIPIAIFLPKVIQLVSHQDQNVRVEAIAVVIEALYNEMQTVDLHVESFIRELFNRLNDPSPAVHKELCKAFVALLSKHYQLLLPGLNHISSYMFNMTQVPDTEVALQACEFWLTIAEHELVFEYLRPYLGSLIPVLVKCMVYSQEELDDFEMRMEESSAADRPEDIKPVFHSTKEHSHGHNDEEEEEEEEDDYDEQWTIRKCSAATLDQLSTNFGDEILVHLLPILKDELYHAEWLHRECGILILGAISEGCFNGIVSHLPDLTSYLIQAVDDPQPLIRIIAVWTISRYSQWICSDNQGATTQQHLVPALYALLKRMDDKIKKVQEASGSAIATLFYSAGKKLVPYIPDILQQYNMAFNKYLHRKNVKWLFDFIATLADAVGEDLARDEYLKIFMPPLISKYNEYADDDSSLFPLFEALQSIAVAIGIKFLPYSQHIYQRCINILGNSLKEIELEKLQQSSEYNYIDRDFMTISLDMISTIVQALGPQMKSLTTSVEPSLMMILATCLADEAVEVRQSGYALLGDLAIYSFDIIEPHLDQLLVFMLNNFDYSSRFPQVCNNVVWSLGEITVKWGSNIAKYIPNFMEHLVKLLNRSTTQLSLKENCAICLSRFGLAAPNLVAPHIQHFAPAWCNSLLNLEDNAEKESAFLGMCQMAKINPHGLQECFSAFCQAIENYRQPSGVLESVFQETLEMFRQLAGANWEGLKATFPSTTQLNLHTRFGV